MEQYGRRPPPEPEAVPQTRDRVYKQLRRDILRGRLKPGERLVERRLAAQLGASRTPVREALRSLQQEGLVYHSPHRGAVVAEVRDEDINEVYRIRAVLEGLAARMAAERIQPEQLARLPDLLEAIQQCAEAGDLDGLDRAHQEFNDVIYRAADSPRLYRMITSLADYIGRVVRVGYGRPGRVAKAIAEHRQLVEAIRMRDGDLAERVAREHINKSRHAYFAVKTRRS